MLRFGCTTLRISVAALRLVDLRGALGFEEAEVCFGAGGGLRSPATKSKMGASFVKMLLRSASMRPSGRGIHVPAVVPVSNSYLLYDSQPSMHTLIFAITALDFLMHSLLHLSFQNSSSCRLIEPGCFEDMCCIDPIILSPSHHTITFDLEFKHRNLEARVRRSWSSNSKNNCLYKEVKM